MKLGYGDLDRDFERPAVTGEVVALRGRKPIPPGLGPITLEMIGLIRPLVPKIRRRDKALAGQLVRAASNLALNVAEAEHAEAEAKKARFVAASACANETQVALRVAVAWGYVEPAEADAPGTLIGRVTAMLWRLTRT
jgi:four helix bundle protein